MARLKRRQELERVCAEFYLVIGVLASYAGVWGHPDVVRALDNAWDARLRHKDLTPWPKQKLPTKRRTNKL